MVACTSNSIGVTAWAKHVSARSPNGRTKEPAAIALMKRGGLGMPGM